VQCVKGGAHPESGKKIKTLRFFLSNNRIRTRRRRKRGFHEGERDHIHTRTEGVNEGMGSVSRFPRCSQKGGAGRFVGSWTGGGGGPPSGKRKGDHCFRR